VPFPANEQIAGKRSATAAVASDVAPAAAAGKSAPATAPAAATASTTAAPKGALDHKHITTDGQPVPGPFSPDAAAGAKAAAKAAPVPSAPAPVQAPASASAPAAAAAALSSRVVGTLHDPFRVVVHSALVGSAHGDTVRFNDFASDAKLQSLIVERGWRPARLSLYGGAFVNGFRLSYRSPDGREWYDAPVHRGDHQKETQIIKTHTFAPGNEQGHSPAAVRLY
jgi:hypothetical protein